MSAGPPLIGLAGIYAAPVTYSNTLPSLSGLQWAQAVGVFSHRQCQMGAYTIPFLGGEYTTLG